MTEQRRVLQNLQSLGRTQRQRQSTGAAPVGGKDGRVKGIGPFPAGTLREGKGTQE